VPAVSSSRPGRAVCQTSAQPGRAGVSIPRMIPPAPACRGSAVGAAPYLLSCANPCHGHTPFHSNDYVHAVCSIEDRKDLIPTEFEKRLYSLIASIAALLKCRAYGARIILIDTPALPGWADVWRSALRALGIGFPAQPGLGGRPVPFKDQSFSAACLARTPIIKPSALRYAFLSRSLRKFNENPYLRPVALRPNRKPPSGSPDARLC
jgi:hypothetical protein